MLNIGLKLSKCRALIYHLFSQEIAIPTGDLVVNKRKKDKQKDGITQISKAT